MAEVPEGPDVRNDERETELIFRAHLPKVDAAIFDGEAAAAAVVTELNDLVLQRLVFEVVAETGNEIKAFAGFAAVTDEPANLVRKRLLEREERGRQRNGHVTLRGIVIQTEMGDGSEKFPIRLHFQERADGDEPLEMRIVLKNLLQIVSASGSDLEITDDGRPVERTECKSERRDGIERLEDVALSIDDGASKGGIKIVLLDDMPENELLRLAVTVFPEESLCKAIFDFAGVGQCGIGIEMDKVREAIHPGDVAVGDGRFNGVLVPASWLVLFQGSAVEESFERGRAEFKGELTSVARDGNGTDQTGGIVGIPIASGTESSGSGYAEPRTKVQRNGNAGRQFVAVDEVGSLNIFIAAEHHAGKSVEAEIYGNTTPGGLLDGAEARFRQIPKRHARGGNRGHSARGRGRGSGERQETLVAEAREIKAEAAKIVREECGAAHFGVDGLAKRIGERKTESERGKMVVVRYETPAAGEQRLYFEALLLATLRTACPVSVEEAAVLDAKIGVLNRSVFEGLG